MIAHISTFVVAVRDCRLDSGHMLVTVASGLFFVETGAFLLVVTAFRREIRSYQTKHQVLYSVSGSISETA